MSVDIHIEAAQDIIPILPNPWSRKSKSFPTYNSYRDP